MSEYWKWITQGCQSKASPLFSEFKLQASHTVRVQLGKNTLKNLPATALWWKSKASAIPVRKTNLNPSSRERIQINYNNQNKWVKQTPKLLFSTQHLSRQNSLDIWRLCFDRYVDTCGLYVWEADVRNAILSCRADRVFKWEDIAVWDICCSESKLFSVKM